MSATHAGTGEPVNTPRQVCLPAWWARRLSFSISTLCDGGGAGVSQAVFSGRRRGDGEAGFSGDIWDCVSGAADWVSPVWPLWRPDRRKTTLVVALATMGVSTVAIGVLPTYAMIGLTAPLLLALCRFGQGLGLGGEWGGAVLLAIENAPAHKRAWYGMFPQLAHQWASFCRAACFWSCHGF